MDEYTRDFVQESEENITRLNNSLLELEQSPDDSEAMDEVFRMAHTLKGNCGTMGYDGASDLAHAIEDRLDDIRAGRLDVTPELMDEIFDAVDELEGMIDEIRRHGEPQRDPSATIDQLHSLAPEDVLTPPSESAIGMAIDAATPPDEGHNVYFVRLDIEPSETANNGRRVVEALIDAFDLLGTVPDRGTIDAGEYGGELDAVFGTPVTEAAISNALEPVDAVQDFVIVEVTDRAREVSGEDRASEAAVDTDAGGVRSGATASTEPAEDMSVDDLLDEFDDYDDLDEMVEHVQDADGFDELGDHGTFDDVEVELDVDAPDPLADLEEEEPPTAAEAPEMDSAEPADAEAAEPQTEETDGADEAATGEDEIVDDATETFKELKQEVDPVGFDELQDELDDLEFDQYDQEDEVGFDELLDEDELEDDEFDPFGGSAPGDADTPPADEASPGEPTLDQAEATSEAQIEDVDPEALIEEETGLEPGEPDAPSGAEAVDVASDESLDESGTGMDFETGSGAIPHDQPAAGPDEVTTPGEATPPEPPDGKDGDAFADELFGATEPAASTDAADAASDETEAETAESGAEPAEGEAVETVTAKRAAEATAEDPDPIEPKAPSDSAAEIREDADEVTTEPEPGDVETPDESGATETAPDTGATDAVEAGTGPDAPGASGTAEADPDGEGGAQVDAEPEAEPDVDAGIEAEGAAESEAEAEALGPEEVESEAEVEESAPEAAAEPGTEVGAEAGVAPDEIDPADASPEAEDAVEGSIGSGADASETEAIAESEPGTDQEPEPEPKAEPEPAPEPASAEPPEAEVGEEPEADEEPDVEPEPAPAEQPESEPEPEPVEQPEADEKPPLEPTAEEAGASSGVTEFEPDIDLDTGEEVTFEEDYDDFEEMAASGTVPEPSTPAETETEMETESDVPSAEGTDAGTASGVESDFDATDDLTPDVDLGTEADAPAVTPSEDVPTPAEPEPSTESAGTDRDDATEPAAPDEPADATEPGDETEAADSGGESSTSGEAFRETVDADLDSVDFEDVDATVEFGPAPPSEAEPPDDSAGVAPAGPDEELDEVEVEEFEVDEEAGPSVGDVDVDDVDVDDLTAEVEAADEAFAELDLEGSSAEPDFDGLDRDFGIGANAGASPDAGIGSATADDADDQPVPGSLPVEIASDPEELPDRDVDLDELLPTPPEEVTEGDGEDADETQTVRVDIDRVDDLLNLVEGLVTTRARLRRAVESGESLTAIDQEIDDLEDLVGELQDTVMDVRLMPLSTVANRLPRTVRDIARDQDKRVSFEMEGGDVEIDRSILDDIDDPLMHLVRNAVDHGIEPPEEREAAGKDPEGTVVLSARRQRDQVVVEVEDDGRGLDPDRLREEAVEGGFLSRDVAEDLSDDEIYDLVFEPGFSTTEDVSDVSGRGVGMDVVSTTVESFGGTVSIESEPGAGTTVSMNLPVTVAISDVLFVRSGEEEFGVPLKAVEEIGGMGRVETVDGEECFVDGEDAYPLVRLAETLETRGATRNDDGKLVKLREDVREIAIHCDEVRGQQEVVVRPFEGVLGDIPGLSGATVLGEGDVVNILDVNTL